MAMGDETTAPTVEVDLLTELRRQVTEVPTFGVAGHGVATTEGTRSINEDAVGVADGRLFAVADGVGGHRHGELASAAAVSALVANPKPASNVGPSSLRDAILDANAAVLRLAADLDERCGTTVAVLALTPTHAVLGWVGDSRILRRRNGELHCLTRDHSVANQLVDEAIPVELAVERGIRLNLLSSYLGARDPTVSVAAHPLRGGDRFLVCSDGIHGQLTNDQLIVALGVADGQTAAESLVAMSIHAGGRDNATAVVVDIGPGGVHGF